eukprot:TRINITY_DN1583_c1_g1_i2.p1 TRINITY_DN1583_c1_g1~~TRINITY_DN1583_c1_g1_i2.p1  ORF type:complete len:424 (+),score=191.87 TRINITY_DN1583_c1_g1_i2:714-1985(+)
MIPNSMHLPFGAMRSMTKYVPTIIPENLALAERLRKQQAQQLAANQQVTVNSFIKFLYDFRCRVYVGSLPYDLTEDALKQAFAPIGPIKCITIMKDPTTQKSKGFAFVDYENPTCAEVALQKMHGVVAFGRVIKVGRSSYAGQLPSLAAFISGSATMSEQVKAILGMTAIEALQSVLGKDALVPQLPQSLQELMKETQDNRIIITMIPVTVKDLDIKVAVSKFGKIKTFVSTVDPTGVTCTAFVDFEVKKSADDAIAAATLEVVGKKLSINKPNSVQTTQESLLKIVTNTIDAAAIKPINIKDRNEESLSIEENMTINSSQRFSIMEKLSRGSSFKNCCLLLQNMVAPNEIELEEDVKSEASKFGQIEQFKVVLDNTEPDQNNYKVYILFKTNSDALRAHVAFNGRWFAGKKVVAELIEKIPE